MNDVRGKSSMYMNHKERLAKKNRQEKTWDYAYPYWLKSLNVSSGKSTSVKKNFHERGAIMCLFRAISQGKRCSWTI